LTEIIALEERLSLLKQLLRKKKWKYSEIRGQNMPDDVGDI
jgi:hypothetical protein